MALNIFSKWASRSNEPDANYPTGSFKNRSAQGEKDGTPLVAEWGNDITGFTDALLNAAGIPHSGLADTMLQSDRFMAIKRYIVMRAAAALTSQGNGVLMYSPGLGVEPGDVVIREDGSGMTASHRVYYSTNQTPFILSSDINDDINSGDLKLINIENMIAGIASNASAIASNASAIASNASAIASNDVDINAINTELPKIGRRLQQVWSGTSKKVSLNSLPGGFPGNGWYKVMNQVVTGSEGGSFLIYVNTDTPTGGINTGTSTSDTVPNNTLYTYSVNCNNNQEITIKVTKMNGSTGVIENSDRNITKIYKVY